MGYSAVWYGDSANRDYVKLFLLVEKDVLMLVLWGGNLLMGESDYEMGSGMGEEMDLRELSSLLDLTGEEVKELLWERV